MTTDAGRRAAVTVRISGGLGNQLFMYAAARRLSSVHEVALRLDVRSGFRNDGYKRSYALGDYAIEAPSASRWASYDEPLTGRARELAALVRERVGVPPRQWVVDDPYRFDPAILDVEAGRARYLRGYFQSERYFADIADLVRSDLRYTGSVSEESRAVADAIARAENPCGVHVRALYAHPQVDDEADLPSADHVRPSATFVGSAYYRGAAERMVTEQGEATFFVFSDHPDVAEAHLDLPGETVIVRHNPHSRATEDLWLLSRCRHHIICGSSFGWWGAWLGEHTGQSVIATTVGFPNRDMIPDRWTQLPPPRMRLVRTRPRCRAQVRCAR